MGFIEVIEKQRSNLKSEEFVYTLYKDLVTECETEDQENLIQFFLHIEPDQIYMQNLLNTLNSNTEEIISMLSDLKVYFLTFLNFCMRKKEPCYSENVRILAATLYIKLITIPGTREKFLKIPLLVKCITVAIDPSDKIDLLHQLVSSLFTLVFENIMDIEPLVVQVVNGAFSVIIIRNTDQILKGFDGTDLKSRCFQNIKNIIQCERNDDAFVIASLTCLFNPFLTTYYLSSNNNNRTVTSKNFKNFLVKELLGKFRPKQNELLVSAFFKIWNNKDFMYYEDVVLFINEFKQEQYSEIIRKMGLLLLSKNHENFHINMLNLLHAVFSNLPPFSEKEKLMVVYEVALRYNVMLCHDSTKCARKAIETLSKICLLQNSSVRSIICNYANKDSLETVSLNPLLRYFLQSTKKKWVSGITNTQVTNIVCIMVSYANVIKQQLVYEVLHALCWDCTPFSLKPCINVLEELFLKLKTKRESIISRLIIKIFFKMALHSDSTSQDYVIYLYQSMFKSKTINNIHYPCDYYVSSILGEEDLVEQLFQKCTKLRLMKKEHVEYAINTMDYKKESQLKLLRCLVSYTNYKEVRKVCQYILANFRHLSLSSNFKHVLCIYNILLENKGQFTENELSEIEAIYSNLHESVANQRMRVESYHNSYVILQKSQNLLQINDNTAFAEINTKYMEALESCLFTDEKILTKMYFAAEHILRSKNLPPQRCIQKITELTTYESLLDIKERDPVMWFPLLHLAETLTLKKKSKNLEHILKTINASMRSGQYSSTYKIYLLKVLHTLCIELTREFENLIHYSFKELSEEDIAIKKLVSTFVEELIENEYLKLSAEQFFLFAVLMAQPEARIFMKDLLSKRFVISQSTVIARHFVSFILYMNLYQHPSHPISEKFETVIKRLRTNITEDTHEIYNFLYIYLPIKYKMNVLMEINDMLMDYTYLKLKVTDQLMVLIDDFLFIYKISSHVENCTIADVYTKGIKIIKKDWKKSETDNANNEFSINQEIHTQIMKTLSTLLTVFFFNERQNTVVSLRRKLFYLILHWIIAFKPNIIHSIQSDDGDDLNAYFAKLEKFYMKNKENINQHTDF